MTWNIQYPVMLLMGPLGNETCRCHCLTSPHCFEDLVHRRGGRWVDCDEAAGRPAPEDYGPAHDDQGIQFQLDPERINDCSACAHEWKSGSCRCRGLSASGRAGYSWSRRIDSAEALPRWRAVDRLLGRACDPGQPPRSTAAASWPPPMPAAETAGELTTPLDANNTNGQPLMNESQCQARPCCLAATNPLPPGQYIPHCQRCAPLPGKSLNQLS